MNKGGLKKVHSKRNLEGLEIGKDYIDVTEEKEVVVNVGKEEIEEPEGDGEVDNPVPAKGGKSPKEVSSSTVKEQNDWDEWRQFMSDVVIKRSYFIIPEKKNRAGYVLRKQSSVKKLDSGVIRRSASITQLTIEDLCLKGIIQPNDKNKLLNVIEELVKSSLDASKQEMQETLNYITKIGLKMTGLKNDYYDKVRKEQSNGGMKENGNSKKKHKA